MVFTVTFLFLNLPIKIVSPIFKSNLTIFIVINMREIIRQILKEVTEDKNIEIIHKILKRIIPDNSIFTSSYDMPYASTGRVDVYMEYSLNPKTNIWYSPNDDGIDYEGTIYLTIDKLLYKGPHDSEYEVVRSYYHIPEYIYEELESYLLDRIRKIMGNLSVDFDYKYQPDKDY